MMRSSSEDSSELRSYIARVQAFPALSREEEHELALRVRAQGDRDAARRILEANLRHVVSIALGYRRYGVRIAELIAEGNVGLVTALKKFDPDRGTRFVTYAAHWIRAFVLDYVIRGWSLVGVGAGPLRSRVFFRLRREKAKVMAATQDAAEVAERLAERFRTTPERITLLAQRLEARDVSLDAPLFDGQSLTALDALPSPDDSQETGLLDRERTSRVSECVRAAVGELDPRERFIIEARMMADASDEMSLAEIGRQLGVSRERARQLEARAVQKLRQSLKTCEDLAAVAHDQAA
jgi:RNA polymerase sigma-32 factor